MKKICGKVNETSKSRKQRFGKINDGCDSTAHNGIFIFGKKDIVSIPTQASAIDIVCAVDGGRVGRTSVDGNTISGNSAYIRDLRCNRSHPIPRYWNLGRIEVDPPENHRCGKRNSRFAVCVQ